MWRLVTGLVATAREEGRKGDEDGGYWEVQWKAWDEKLKMKWMDDVSEKKNINEVMKERETYWMERERECYEGEGFMNGERELIRYEWNQPTSPTWPGV